MAKAKPTPTPEPKPKRPKPPASPEVLAELTKLGGPELYVADNTPSYDGTFPKFQTADPLEAVRQYLEHNPQPLKVRGHVNQAQMQSFRLSVWEEPDASKPPTRQWEVKVSVEVRTFNCAVVKGG